MDEAFHDAISMFKKDERKFCVAAIQLLEVTDLLRDWFDSSQFYLIVTTLISKHMTVCKALKNVLLLAYKKCIRYQPSLPMIKNSVTAAMESEK